MKAYWRVEVQLNTFFELSLDGGEWSASCLSCFTHRVRALYPLDRRLGGPQSHYGHSGEEKNSQPLPGIEP